LSDLARLLLTKPTNLAIAIKSLKKAGSVVRSRDNIDRRSAFLEMTTEGYAIWRDIDKEIGEFLENYTSEFAEEELDLSYKVMNLCVEELQEQYCVV